ncbi:hypothetical protein [Crocosphaera sp.]|uniref:hypothetical protein n=1 Tax=Crocosphaera sp. TaxID=2729996 RepID=UPI003F293E8C|nr:hypothetical protein [Crocosphaera sp.]
MSYLNLNAISLSFLGLLGMTPLALGMTINDFESGDFANFDLSPSGIGTVVDSTFGVSPTQGTFQALLETGITNTLATPVFNPIEVPNTLEGFAGVPGFLFEDGPGPISALGSYVQGSALRLQTPLTVEAGQSLRFDYNFLTDETNSADPNNDLAFLTLNEMIIPIASVDTASFISSPTSFVSETEYQSFTYTFLSSGTFNLGFAVVDENAFSGHSGLLLDNIELVSPTQTQIPESSMLVGLMACVAGGLISAKSKRQ